MTQLGPAAGLALLAVVMGYGSYYFHSQQQAFVDTETTTTDAIEGGQVKLRGEIEPIETVRSPVTGEEVVAVNWQLRADPENDDEGVKTVIKGRRAADFELVDDHGRVRVEPMDATLVVSDENTVTTHSEPVDTDTIQAFEEEIEGDADGRDHENVHVRTSGALNTSLGGADFQAEYRNQRFRHEALKPGDEVNVLGDARNVNGDVVVGDGDGEFLVSDRSENDLVSDLETRKRLLLGVAIVMVVASLYFLLIG